MMLVAASTVDDWNFPDVYDNCWRITIKLKEGRKNITINVKKNYKV